MKFEFLLLLGSIFSLPCYAQEQDSVIADTFAIRLSQEYIGRLERTIMFISDKSKSLKSKNFEINKIVSYFTVDAKIEVSSKNRIRTTKYEPRRYFEILRDLNYDWVEIKFDLNNLTSLSKIDDDIWFAQYEIYQHFKGWKTKDVKYYDYTIKSVEIYVYRSGNYWNIKIGNINVVKTL